jgi:hypothetical protein
MGQNLAKAISAVEKYESALKVMSPDMLVQNRHWASNHEIPVMRDLTVLIDRIAAERNIQL